MSDPCNGDPSRRGFLKTSAGLLAGATAAPLLPERAQAQANGDAELARVQGQRRVLIKGGVVLSLDRQVGDFALADVLIEDGKIREVRPNIAVTGDAAAVVDATNHIVIPGFIAGKVRKWRGNLTGVDVPRVLRLAQEARDGVVRRSGFPVNLLG